MLLGEMACHFVLVIVTASLWGERQKLVQVKVGLGGLGLGAIVGYGADLWLNSIEIGDSTLIIVG